MNKFFRGSFPKLFSQTQGVQKDEKETTGTILPSASQANDEIIELVTTKDIKSLNHQVENDSQSIIQILNSQYIYDELQGDEKVFLLHICYIRTFDDPNTDELQTLSSKFSNKSIVIFLTTKNDEKFSIYWKLKEIQELFIVKHYGEDFNKRDMKVYEFMTDYLARSLSKGELGLFKEWAQYTTRNEVGAHLLADSRSYNLLLLAAEVGNAEVVKILLDLGANTTADDGVNAQSLAWKNRHSEVLLVLAQANLPFPEEIDINQLSDDFKTFYKNTKDLHRAIISKNEEKVKEILNRGENLEFYYNLSNKSAARVAVDAKAFDIYEILVIHEIFLAPHEYEQGVFDDLEYEEQKLIRELHHKHSRDLPGRHINILMAHSSIAHDVADTKSKLRHVYEAYKYLSQDPRLNTILKVVAASKKFQVIFDFNRDAVNIADPTVADNTEGVFYPMGRIYIGARQLLDETTKSNAVATLAHELCHYAVNLVYSNNANPYKGNDNQMLQEFEEINEKCQKEKGKEQIIDLVYECYPTDMYHAELIVRPAHMIATYLDQPEKLAEVGEIFPELFEFFERIIKEMEGAIPEIERQEEVIIERKDEKISRLRKKLVLSIIFSVIGIIAVAAVVALIFHTPIYTFNGLSTTNQLRVKDGNITYKNIEVRFRDLFPENSTAYEKLTSDHISQIFDGHALNFSDSHFLYLNDLVHLDWQDLTKKLKKKVLASNFTFQSQSLKLKKIPKKINSEVFNSLTSEQIVDVLDGKKLVVGKMLENRTEFYVERKFVFEGQKMNLNTSYLHNTYETLNELVSKTEHKRILILSSEAGAGKTVTFEQLAIRIKQRFPLRWVSYIDLKNHTKYYNADIQDVYTFLESLAIENLENEFEKEIFNHSYHSGNVVFLWNGFDEISPTYNKFIVDLLDFISKNTTNVQFINTRPFYSEQLKTELHTLPYELLPFDYYEKKAFLSKLFTLQNISSDKIESYVDKFENISRRFNYKTPLMLKLIGEVHEDLIDVEDENFYKVYEKFVSKKVGIWQENSEFAKNFTNFIFSYGSSSDIKAIYQKYALINEFPNPIIYRKLELGKRKIPNYLPLEEISRMGILYLNTETKFEFAHKTFAEFFVAQTLVENLYLLKDYSKFDEQLLIVLSALKTKPGIQFFLDNFLDAQSTSQNDSFDPQISQLLKGKYKNFMFDSLLDGTDEYLELLFKFFNKDHEVLIDQLRINENETFYTASFDLALASIGINPEEVENLGQKFLTKDEFKKFLKGKNQRGKVLFGLAWYEMIDKDRRFHKYNIKNRNATQYLLIDFFDTHKENLTQNERKELLVHILGQTALCLSLPGFKSIYYENLWNKNINLLTKDETVSMIVKSFTGFTDDSVKNLNLPKRPHEYERCFEFILSNAEELLTESEMLELIINEKMLYLATANEFLYKHFWSIFERYTDERQQKEILLRDYSFGRIKLYDGNGAANYLPDYTPFKIFHFSLFSFFTLGDSNDFVSSVYKEYFSTSTIQDFFHNPSDFIVYLKVYGKGADMLKFLLYHAFYLFYPDEERLLEFSLNIISLMNSIDIYQ